MLKDKCLMCGSSDLYQGRLAANGGVSFGSKKSRFSLKFLLVDGAACLSCGFVAPVLKDQDIETVRKWKAEESHDTALGADKPSSSFSPQALAIILAIIGFMAAMAAQFMNVADKMK